jgi:hypothetical protein
MAKMARGFMYVYERIFKEQNDMQREFRKIPVNGRRTSRQDIRKIRKIISDSTYKVSKECQVIVNYPEMRIEGKEVKLGEVSIILPDFRIIGIQELKKIETRSK